jgi:hypothetical protein
MSGKAEILKTEIDQKPSSPRLLPSFVALRLCVKFNFHVETAKTTLAASAFGLTGE